MKHNNIQEGEMMENLDLYRCEICGNMVEVILSGGGEIICCGKSMQKLLPKTHEEAIQEKHVPVFVKYDDNAGDIRVGEVLHPMLKDHYIMFIQAVSQDKRCTYLKYYVPSETPMLYLNNFDQFNYAREFCNIHGLWEGKNND